jgi:hypothetical protein
MKATVTKILMLVAIAAGSLGLTACSDEDLAFGAGVVIGVIIGDDDGHHHHHHRPPPRYRRHNLMALDGAISTNTAVAETVEAVEPETMTELEIASAHLALPLEQTEVVMNALAQAKQKDFSAIKELGLSKRDLRQLARGEDPSASTLRELASNLNIELGEAHNLIQTLKADLETGLQK